MTTDDVDSVDLSLEHEDNNGHDGKHSRRDRLKDALNRTKTKISKVKEERDAKKSQHQQEKDKMNHSLDDTVNDFLAAGRSSMASQRPSIGSTSTDPRPSMTASFESARPSTADSQTQVSPRRAPPVNVPRIDVSASTRFPNAKDVNPDALTPQPESAIMPLGGHQYSSMLKPEYKSRSQSSSSLASGNRRARKRGLSVGFANSPPIIIGEGGDEAEAPAIEISRAKARARSASPQGRKPYPGTNVHIEARRQMPNRGISDNTADLFASNSLARTQGSTLTNNLVQPHIPRGPHDDDLIPGIPLQMQPGQRHVNRPPADDDFVPKPFARSQTGFSDHASPHPIHRAPSIPVQQAEPPIPNRHLPPMQTAGLDLTKEFEMTLNLGSASNSPLSPQVKESPIAAPKPKRAPPSYDLIEGGGRPSEDKSEVKSSSPRPTQNKAPPPPPPPLDQPRQQYVIQHSNRKPIPISKSESPQQDYPQPPIVQPHAHSQPPPVPSQEEFPPPPHRTLTQTARIPKKLERIVPRSNRYPTSDQQGTGVTRDYEAKIPDQRGLDASTHREGGYGSFSDRQAQWSGREMTGDRVAIAHNAPRSTTRPIATDVYETSPSTYSGSAANSAIESTPTGMRFYESINKGAAPEGFI